MNEMELNSDLESLNTNLAFKIQEIISVGNRADISAKYMILHRRSSEEIVKMDILVIW